MNELLKNKTLMGQFRTLLAFVAGIFVAKGKMSQEFVDSMLGNLDSVFSGIGAVSLAVASIWSAKSKKPDLGIPPGIEKLSVIALLVFATGCTTLEVGDAKLKSVLNKRAIGDLEYSSTDTNGVTHKLKMKGVQSDQVSGIGAIAEGFASGVVKTLVPQAAAVSAVTNAVAPSPDE